jgi:hypothetical protein
VNIRDIITALAASVTVLLMTLAFTAITRPATAPDSAHATVIITSPRSVVPAGLCAVRAVPGRQLATVVVPGDAGNYWLPGARGYAEYVCTDGTLVHVAGYGNH